MPLYVSILGYVCTWSVETHRGQKRALDTLKLELQGEIQFSSFTSTNAKVFNWNWGCGWLPSIHKTPNSNPNTEKKKKPVISQNSFLHYFLNVKDRMYRMH